MNVVIFFKPSFYFISTDVTEIFYFVDQKSCILVDFSLV